MPEAEDQRVNVGEAAPDFALPDDQGRIVRLSDFRGRPVVLFMYPKDNTPGCTLEACSFRDNFDRLQEAGAAVLGLSPDSVESHRRFKARHHFPFPLLSDEGGQTAALYGAWKEKSLFGRRYRGIERSTFIIDSEGIVRRVFRKVKVGGHVDEVLKALADL
ncbi:MAG: thioredoxin-dependent thiol peroxidase [Firmicutes bacterium]|nr:thioredoxin-dependent thiol peroxidase [Bacillota bacterium]